MGLRAPAALALAFLALAGCGSSAPSRHHHSSRLPSDFLGMVSDDAFAAAGSERAQILAAERRTGVELLRRTFDWSSLEPRRGVFAFARYDAYVAAAARAGIEVLPVLFGRPSWEPPAHEAGAQLTATTTSPPARTADFAAFAAALARRYGPDGTFWRAHPSLPPHEIRSWQIWNEPNLPVYWAGRPSAGQYVALLGAAARAIRGVTSDAEIVTAGIPDSTLGIGLDRYVKELLATGASASFDTLAIDPYARSDAGAIAATVAARALLDAAGLRRTPIWVTELGWASGGPGSSFTVGPRLQARYVLATITSLAQKARALRIRGVVYFDWRDAPPYPGVADFWGLHTGLLSAIGAGKPALSAYYQAAGVIGALPGRR